MAKNMVLIARRADKLPQTCGAFEARGFSCVPLPILTVTPLDVIIPPAAKGIILTSSAAVAAARGCGLPCYTVGKKTAAAARGAGLEVIYSGGSDAAALAEWLKENIAPTTLCHITTKQANNKWYTILRQADFNILPLEGYTTTYMKNLPDEVVCCLTENRVSSLVVFSVKSAQKTLELLKKNGFDPRQLDVAAAISPKVAEALAVCGVSKSRIRVAKAPLSEELINVLEQPSFKEYG